ncbi:MAG TPA: hypothetical protein VH500_13305 [Nitrososphaeraceae archaeon]
MRLLGLERIDLRPDESGSIALKVDLAYWRITMQTQPNDILLQEIIRSGLAKPPIISYLRQRHP